MAESASEWGFAPFAASPSYPDLPADAADRESGGKRSQKTDIRRRLQLERLVDGIIKLPATSQKSPVAKAKPESRPSIKDRIEVARAAPDSGRDVAVRNPKSGAVRAALSKARVPGASDASNNGLQQSQSENGMLLSNTKPGSSKARKRKSDTLQPAELSVIRGDRAGDDQHLSRKQQKQRLRQQLYEARKHGHTLVGAQQHAQPDAVPAHSAAVGCVQSDADSPSHGIEKSCTDDTHIDVDKQPAISKPALTKKQQKRLERQQRYQSQQLARQPPAHTSTDLAASSSVSAVNHMTAAQTGQVKIRPDEQTALHASLQKAQRFQNTSEQRSGSSETTLGAGQSETMSGQHLQSRPVRSRSAVVLPKPTIAAEDCAAPRLPPQHQSRTADSGGSAPSGLLDKMRAKLQGGRFRWLNEQMYSSTGGNAFELMQGEPDLYSQYHEGFRQQAADWPQQPVELAISWLKNKPKDVIVADFGCGDARIAAEAAQKVHSFDLVAELPGVVACNMASVPLESTSIDAAVFCLALMGTDYGAFLQEAHRVLKQKGWLWICEVRSRFAGQSTSAARSEVDLSSAEGSDVQQAAQSWVMVRFTKALQRLGFRLVQRRVINKMFVVFELQKSSTKGNVSIEWPELKGCVYRKR